MFSKCPGAANIRTPTLTVKQCPQCDAAVEIFSNDIKVECEQCGFTIYNNIESCIKWCSYAKECVGEEMFHRLREAPPPENSDE